MVKSVTIPAHQLKEPWITAPGSTDRRSRASPASPNRTCICSRELDTFKIIPWERGGGYPTARVICRVMMPDGQAFAGNPREVLLRALDEAKGRLRLLRRGVEFFLFHPNDDSGGNEPLPHDRGSYSDLSTDQAGLVGRRWSTRWRPWASRLNSHHEVAVGRARD